MIVPIPTNRTATTRLLAMLREQHDDDTPPLRAATTAWGSICIIRQDGSEPSETEQRHIRATIAAHAAESL